MQIDPRLAEIDDCLYRLAVRAVILHENKVLLVHEKDDEWWSFPGGGIDHGEDILEALPREIAEELGVPASEIKTDYQIVHTAIGGVVNGVPRANLFYRVEVPVGSIRPTDDVLEVGWFTSAEATTLLASPSTGDAIKLAKIIEAPAAAREHRV